MIDWLSTYAAQSLLLAIALLALLESLAFVGILVPGVAVLASLSWLAGQQAQPLSSLLLAGFIGAVLGDWISFLLGRYCAPWIARRHTLKDHPQWLTEGERFFQRHGGSSIFLGRFVGPLRAVVPFIAGSCGMPTARFVAFNVLSAALWAPAYLLPGYWLGEQASELEMSWNSWIQLIALILFMAMLLHALHQQLEPGRWLSERMIGLGWFHAQRTGIQLFLGLCASSLIFLMVSRTQGWLQAFDQEFYTQLQIGISGVQQFMLLFTLLGDKIHLLGSTVLIVSLCLLFNYRRTALNLLIVMIGVTLLNIALKHLFEWQRPDIGVGLYETFSFPSGHSSGTAALLGSLAVLFALGRPPSQKRWIYWGFLPPILLTALSRVVLGVHWPLDVAAGILEGLILVTLLRWQYADQKLDAKPDPLLIASIAVLQAIFTLSYISLSFPEMQRFYGI